MKPEIHRILVPLDFSPASDRALAYAAALAEEFGAPLFLLHVIEDRLMTGPWPSEVYLGELPKLRDDLIKDAERRMRLSLEALEKDGLTATGGAAGPVTQLLLTTTLAIDTCAVQRLPSR
mgnify:CR=1 FL=1